MVEITPEKNTKMIEKITMQEYLRTIQQTDEYYYTLGVDADNNFCKSSNNSIVCNIGGYKTSCYPIPIGLFILKKPDNESKTFTITLCKLNRKVVGHSYDFKLSSLENSSSNNRAGFLLFVCNENDQYVSYAEFCAGNFSNVREIMYNGMAYMAVDVYVQQYGHCYITITGIHQNIADIMDVTGNFTEAGA